MSGPDERRGTDGGEHPLDVDARFADIVAHFHDGEPATPRLVDDAREPDGRAAGAGPDGADADAGRGTDGATEGTTGGTTDRGTDGEAGASRAAGSGSDDVAGAATPPGRTAGRQDEDRFRADLEADERAEREARAARAARISAEVDRAVDGPDSHYVPADPPPLPRPSDLSGRLAWAGVLLGPLLLLLCALLWRSAPPWLVGSIATAMVAGFVYLVWRLPRTRDRDDPGDGAIV